MAERDSNIVNSGVTKDGARFIVKKDLPDVQKQQSRFDEILRKFKLFSLTSSNDSDKILSDMNDKILQFLCLSPKFAFAFLINCHQTRLAAFAYLPFRQAF